ncbi:DMT family transporter [Trinickia diaoshuihuensis]|uniref:DMT family transporter n=1 Tax=Trinickia diaoshuihuensis TaxID=2292265 RepID=UPI000E21FDF3|nr:DMT family transporter [Trinickia diaoshuihuensis]
MNSSSSSVQSRSLASPVAAALAVAFTIVSWASAFPFIRIGLQGLTPLHLAAARFGTAALLVTAWLAYRRPRLPGARDMLRFIGCGFFGIAIYNALLNTGEKTVAPGAASFIVNTLPIFTALFATIFLGERFNRWAWLGSIFSFAGIGVIASGQPGGLVPGAGASLILLAAVCSAAFIVMQRRLVPVYGPLACTAYTILAGALWLAPWLPGALTELSSASAPTAWAVVVLGIFPAALGYATWAYALGYFGAARASNFLYLTPAVATALSIALTGDELHATTAIGGLMVIAGVAYVAWLGRR